MNLKQKEAKGELSEIVSDCAIRGLDTAKTNERLEVERDLLKVARYSLPLSAREMMYLRRHGLQVRDAAREAVAEFALSTALARLDLTIAPLIAAIEASTAVVGDDGEPARLVSVQHVEQLRRVVVSSAELQGIAGNRGNIEDQLVSALAKIATQRIEQAASDGTAETIRSVAPPKSLPSPRVLDAEIVAAAKVEG